MTQVRAVVLQYLPPGLAVARYEVMVAPPLEAGACQVTVRLPGPAVDLALRGAVGTWTADEWTCFQAVDQAVSGASSGFAAAEAGPAIAANATNAVRPAEKAHANMRLLSMLVKQLTGRRVAARSLGEPLLDPTAGADAGAEPVEQ